jgi:hypothetical protein
MATTTKYILKLDAYYDANNCLLLRVQGTTAPLPTPYSFYTGTLSQVEVRVYYPAPSGLLYFAGTTYPDSDGNSIISVNCVAGGEFEVEPILPSTAAPTTTTQAKEVSLLESDGTTEGAGTTAPVRRAPSTRVRLMPKMGYPPSGGGDT